MLNSSIWRKVFMAFSGLFLVFFIIGHIAGNLQIFLGQEAINAYAKFLKDNPKILWPARIGLIFIVLVHIIMAITLKIQNSTARPQAYKYEATVKATKSSKFMIHSGLLILVFIILHLLHFTLGYLQPEFFHLVDSKGRHDVYSMMVHGFQNKYYSIGYIVCMIALGSHLSHALSSVFQSIGFYHKNYSAKIKAFAPLIAWGLALAYISIPVSVLLGIIKLPS